MKPLFLFILSLSTLFCTAQTEEELISKADRLETALDENNAYFTFLEALKINPNNYYSNWKVAELCSRIGARQPTLAKKTEFFQAGKFYAQRAIKLNPNGADGYYTLVVSMGRLAITQSGKEKLRSVKEIKVYIDKTLALNPNYARAWHALGKWHYEVSNLGFMERTAARIMYGGIPSASLKESIAAYEKARQLEPDFNLNYLELAKAYKRNDQKDKALALLRQLATMPIKTLDDKRIRTEGARLLQEWSK